MRRLILPGVCASAPLREAGGSWTVSRRTGLEGSSCTANGETWAENRGFALGPFVSVRGVVEVRLDRRRRAADASGDLCDR
jgi:hypothetical protein